MGFELPQHGSAVADHQRSVVFIDGADNHAVRPDCLGDSDGIALRTQVVHELVDALLRVWEGGMEKKSREIEDENGKKKKKKGRETQYDYYYC